jgi:hypothetical protein
LTGLLLVLYLASDHRREETKKTQSPAAKGKMLSSAESGFKFYYFCPESDEN